MFYLWPFVVPNLFSFMSPTTTMSVNAPGWDYSPATEWGEGDLVIEKEVGRKVATTGRQLGIMGDALVALIKYLENEPLDESDKEDIGRLITMVKTIKPIVDKETGKKELRKIESAKVNLPSDQALLSDLEVMIGKIKHLNTELREEAINRIQSELISKIDR